MTHTDPVVRGLEAFDQFYVREFPKMVTIAYAVSGSRMAAEDLAQEAMIATYRRWPEVGALERPGGWARLPGGPQPGGFGLPAAQGRGSCAPAAGAAAGASPRPC